MAENENEEVTIETEETPEIPAETPPETPPAETPPAGEAPKETPLDVISKAITESGQPRKLVPKADEQAQQDTRPRNADGTFKQESPEEKAAREAAEALKNETPEQKAAREAAEKAGEKKEPDHINDPIPKELKQATQDRIRSLIDLVKTQEALVDQHGQLFGAIQATGATPTEFASMLNYMKAIHSTDPAQLRQAYTMIQAELRSIAVKLGEPLYEVNLLREESNADLVQEIRDGKLTTQRAHEIALARERTKVETARGTSAAKAKTDSETAAADRQFGVDDLNKLQDELVARDGAEVFQQKYDILVPSLKEMFGEMNGRQWRQTFIKFYTNLKLPPKAAAAAAAPAAPKIQPQRPKSPAGAGSGVAPAPKSALEAINAALEM